MPRIRKNKFLISFVIFCLTFCLAFFTPAVYDNVFAAKAAPEQKKVETSAISAVLLDENGKVLYEKNPHQQLPPASVTKIMTLLIAVEAVEKGTIGLDDKISASKNAWRQGGSQIWLEPGEVMSVREILTAIAVVSANDAAVAILEHIYGSEEAAVAAMNEKARAMQLANTHFSNTNGLPGPNHYMSAYDAALIGLEATKHPLYMELCATKEHWLRDGKNWLVNTNKLLWWYAGADGLKTGWTQEAKYCFVGTAKRDGLRLVTAVFGTPEPRSHLRESMKLLDWGYANFASENIVRQGADAGRLKVTQGIEKDVKLVAGKDLNLTIAKGEYKNIRKKADVPSSVAAPVEAGKKYGELIVTGDDEEIARVDLIAEQNVPKAGFFRIFRGVVTTLFALSK